MPGAGAGLKAPSRTADDPGMSASDRLPAGSSLTLDQVAGLAKVSPDEVLTAIRNRQLRAEQRRGEWEILVEDMRRWLARR